MTEAQLAGAALIGLAAGVTGGLAGIGGSMVILSGLHLVFAGARAAEGPGGPSHHLFMAASMGVNVAVTLPASLRHRAEGSLRPGLLPPLLAGTLPCMVAGVLLSDRLNGDHLRVMLAGFLLLYGLVNLVRVCRGRPESLPAAEGGGARLLTSGAFTGFLGGVLGIGGGVLLVPLLQVVCRTPLRQAIATSSAVVCLTALVGAGLKMATLGGHGEDWRDAAALAAAMAPTAVLGSRIGARLMYALPLTVVRLTITGLLLAASGRLAGAW